MKGRERRTHHKSRWGCTSCKRRRVKCDEKKPECTDCLIRNIQCGYLSAQTAVEVNNATARERNALQRAISSADSPSQTAALSLSSSSPSASASNSLAARQALIRVTQDQASLGISNPSPLTFSSTPTANRLLELELLHRWSTRTWRAVYTCPGCDIVLLHDVPRISMSNSYLLNSVFALSAIDLAKHALDPSNSSTILTKDNFRYKSAALVYGNRAIVAFREVLSKTDANIRPNQLSTFLFFASFVALLNLTFPNPKYQTSALETLGTSMALYVGSYCMGQTNLDWLNRAPCSLTLMVKYLLPPLPPDVMQKLDVDTQLALARLASLSMRVRVPVRLAEESLVEVTDSHGESQVNNMPPLACEIPAYKLAVDQIKYTFMSDATNTSFKAMSFSILAVGGRELTAAFKEREPLALFIMMFWAVLIHRSRKSNDMWWVGNLGQDIVDEISEVLVTSPLVRLDGVGETIKWARRDVGLDSDSDSDLSPSSLSFLLLLKSQCGGLSGGRALPVQHQSIVGE